MQSARGDSPWRGSAVTKGSALGGHCVSRLPHQWPLLGAEATSALVAGPQLTGITRPISDPLVAASLRVGSGRESRRRSPAPLTTSQIPSAQVSDPTKQPKPRVDVPRPGRTLAATIEPLAMRLRETASVYAAALGEDGIKAYTTLYWPRDADLRRTPATRHDAAWAVIGTYLAMRSWGGVRDLTPRRAEELFFDGAGGVSLVGMLPAELADTVHDGIASLDDDEIRALLPYLLEPLEPGTRRSVLRDPDQAHARSHRRRSGIYYTPADVAEYMVGELHLSSADIAVLDPACGSGVFLRAAGERMFSALRTNTSDCYTASISTHQPLTLRASSLQCLPSDSRRSRLGSCGTTPG